MTLSTEFKVGLTVIVATAILVLGIIWGKNYRFEDHTRELTVLFENVGGMQPGEPVTINGVKSGKVKSVEPYQRQVLTRLEIQDDVPLYEDARFIVISDELLAGMRVEIFPGESNQPLNMAREPFQGRYGGRIVDVGITIGELAEEMTALTHRIDTTVMMVNDFMGSGALQQDIRQTLANLQQTSSGLKNFVNENGERMGRTIGNLEAGSATFNAILDSNKAAIGGTMQNFSKVSSRLDTISITLAGMLKEIESQQGTLGKMVYDPALYVNLTKALASIDSLAQQIKKEGLDIDLF